MLRKGIYLVLMVLASISLLSIVCQGSELQSRSDESPIYSYEIVDPDGPKNPWGKAAGDINGDGLIDLTVGGHSPRRLTVIERIQRKLGLLDRSDKAGELVWYQNPSWQRHLITEEFHVRTDLEVADIDGDGVNDIVLVTDSGMYWLKNPGWEKHNISSDKLHDVELADLDGDGDIDVVARSQSLFGYNNGNYVYIFRHDAGNQWYRFLLPVPHGEGLALADIDNDSLPDIIVNHQWLKNPGDLSSGHRWQAFNYATDWIWKDVFIDTADINNDGRQDVVLTPAEEAGQYYHIAWFEAPEQLDGQWRKHIIDAKVEAVLHFVAARDVNRDGYVDVLTAEMNQGEDPDEVKVYLNRGDGSWDKQVLATTGSHSMRAVDIDNDFDIDLFGANWQKTDYEGPYAVELWRNKTSDREGWKRHVIDNDRPGQAIFVYAEDIDGDGAKDIVTGAYWYRQPESLEAKWQRFALGDKANNVALVADFDGDSDMDILASGWRGYNQKPSLLERALNRFGIRQYDYKPLGNQFVWGRNDGQGNLQILDNIEPASGDFLQGAALFSDVHTQTNRVLLSWHRAGEGLQSFEIPRDPVKQLWPWSTLSPVSQDEDISVGDIDADGRLDILLGTQWLRNDGPGQWQVQNILEIPGEPDRNQLVDLNNDGLLDVVVGYQAISKKGKLAWYEQHAGVENKWTEHIIAQVVGPMSLSVADVDGDGDMDVIVGEHNLVSPQQARMLWFENIDGKAGQWKGHLIYRGDEHHDGALAVDIDNDGDTDVISIGWSHGKVIVYENGLGQADHVKSTDLQN